MNRVSIGTDPEFFLEDKVSKKKISAIPHVAGTKYDPLFLSNGSKIQHDNVALEFATMPAKDAVDLANMIRETFMIIKPTIPKDLDIVAEASAIFDKDQLEHFEALQFGCDPDYNAWTLGVNVPPSVDTQLRSCGGHLHVGHTEGDGCDFILEYEGKIHTVRLMDVFHGLSSVILDSSEVAMNRRKLYGKAGCYRPTSYGVEYRVMSNFWLKSPVLVSFVDSLLQDALTSLQKEKKSLFKGVKENASLIRTVGSRTIQKVINNSDTEVATDLFKKYVFPELSQNSIDLFNEATHKKYKSIYEEWS